MPQRVDRRVVRLALDPAVPRPVVVGPVAVVFLVGIVVLAFVRDQVARREPVVGRDDVDARLGGPARMVVQVRRAGQPRRQLLYAARPAPPVVADVSPEAVVPLAPAWSPLADLVAVRAHIPGFGDELDALECGVGLHRQLERVLLVDVVVRCLLYTSDAADE